MMLKKVALSLAVDGKSYWEAIILAITNNKFCSLRANFMQELFEQFQGKFYSRKKLSNNSHFITLQIDGQSPNLFYSNYITKAKKMSFDYIAKTNYDSNTTLIIKLLPFST